jgi:hypothetical protein
MPLLEITPEMVGPSRTTPALSYIAGVMMWPAAEDQGRRDEWMRATTAGFIRDAINDVPAAHRAADMGRLINGYDLALTAMPLSVLDQRAEQPFIYGCRAGELFFAAIEMYAGTGKLKLESIKHDMVSRNGARLAALEVIERSTYRDHRWKTLSGSDLSM